MNYYVTLGISKNATAAEIKKAYHQRALQCHPDKNKDPQAEEQFKAISQAYAVLSDVGKRRDHDEALAHPNLSDASASNVEESSVDEEHFAELLAIPTLSSDLRLKFIFEVACTNSDLLAKYCVNIIAILPHRELFFLVKTGPKIEVTLERGFTRLNFGLCNPELGIFERSVKSGRTMLLESYDHLTQTILEQAKHRATALTDIDITAIFMRAMIFDEKEVETIVRDMHLTHRQVTELQQDLFILFREKTVVVSLYGVSEIMVDNLQHRLDCQYKKLVDMLFQLELETKYQASSNKVIDLLSCYKEERVLEARSYFTRLFVCAEFDAFSSEQQELFLAAVVQVPYDEKLLDLLHDLAISHPQVVVDAIFQQVAAEIGKIGLDPKKSHANSGDHRLATIKQKLKTIQRTGNIVDKMQFIFELADHHPDHHHRLSFFVPHSHAESAIIRTCTIWSDKLERIFDNHPLTQVLSDVTNPLTLTLAPQIGNIACLS